MKDVVKLSVRALVESLRSGDLNLESSGATSSLDAIRAHQNLQGARPDGYQKEYPVAATHEEDDVTLEIQGRIDGVLGSLVEEIKTTASELPAEGKRTHWGQLEVYACLYARELELDRIDARLTYYALATGETLELDRSYRREELERIFEGLVAAFLASYRRKRAWLLERDASIRETRFPFAEFRAGQREMAVAVYRTLRNGGEILLQAATGIGKTQATLFPAVKALSEGLTEKIFYLTARTTGRALAEKAAAELGCRLKSVTLTAKDRICFNPEKACNGEECSYARGFYDRIDLAVDAALTCDRLTRETIETVAREHHVCPFELSLELTPSADVIVCDYNYVFDPRVYLRRLFDPPAKLDFALLVDEAHNLVDRARSMFSAEIRKKPFMNLRRGVKRGSPLYRALGGVNRFLLAARKRGAVSEKEPPSELFVLLRKVVDAAEPVLAASARSSFRDELLERVFEALRFLKVGEDWGEEYVACYEPRGRDVKLLLFCSDPARRLSERLESAKASVFFSATLTPPSYFSRLFGCREGTEALRFGSPFPSEHFEVLVAPDIATTYHRREESRDALVALLAALASFRKGKYLFYFPSYQYMNAVHERFSLACPELRVALQKPDMDEAERAAFVARFEDDGEPLTGFAVMGGVFGEGIDLPGERLTGAAVVGVGLPPPSPEREHIRDHFDRDRGPGLGFDYAYVYPGIHRVLQAAGRVIRSESDRGVLLLVDERFARPGYRALLPPEWSPTPVRGADALRESLSRFWEATPELAPGAASR